MTDDELKAAVTKRLEGYQIGPGCGISLEEHLAQQRSRMIPSIVIYISGPMTGLPDWNIPKFDAIADTLRKRGYFVINPADVTREHGTNLKHPEYMRHAMAAVANSTHMVMMDGWRESRGSSTEGRWAADIDLVMVLEPEIDTYFPYQAGGQNQEEKQK